jgi:hypothetical protein
MLELRQGETVIRDVVPGTYVLVPGLGHVYAEAGWEDGEFSIAVKPPIPPAPEPEKTLEEWAADYRWQREVGGMNVGGINVMTDDRSKMLIMGARMKADADPSFTTRFKTTEGVFVSLGAAQIVAVSDALLVHVDQCFALEDTAIAGIVAGTITTPEQVGAVFAA